MNQKQKKEFGQRLEAIMLDKGWNQSELARRAGIGRDNISGYVNGRFFPHPKHLLKLKDALGRDYDKLGLTGEDALPPPIEDPKFKMEQIEDKVHLRLNQILDLETALKIIAHLSK